MTAWRTTSARIRLLKIFSSKKYREIYPEYTGGNALTDEQINDAQGYYFATVKNEYTDNEKSMNSNKEIYDLILRKKEELLSIDNPVQFIFSHSALGVGWDNPNVFNIATLNNSYSDIKSGRKSGAVCVLPLIRKDKEFMTALTFPTTKGLTN